MRRAKKRQMATAILKKRKPTRKNPKVTPKKRSPKKKTQSKTIPPVQPLLTSKLKETKVFQLNLF